MAELLLPELLDSDIEWICATMGLRNFDAPRVDFLKALSTLDVSACPGSGKTTLVVAKLAMLVRKWPYRTRGICVLSHTNAAREEIQRRLGGTIIGQRLFDYPHFIDTIHGFVNRFLALPWLNSNGYPSPTVDNDVTTAYRRSVIGREYWTIQNYLEKKGSGFDSLRICNRDLNFDLGGRSFPAKAASNSYKLATLAIETAAGVGYFCYDEMFVWARALLEDVPEVASWLRQRFPLVIIDEMQDTFELQCSMINEVFPRTSTDIVVQRVGDPNQAIFDDFNAQQSTEDPFPDHDRCLSIPNSFRFGADIAFLASPFALMAVSADGLHGVGPRVITGAPATCPHAVFIFPDDSTKGVLDAYGKHVLNTFNDDSLAEGTVAAVGAVHKDAPDIGCDHKHFPKTVPHYWEGYSAEISRKELHPKHLIQYIRIAQATARASQDLAPGVEKIASGLTRLASLIGNVASLRRRPRSHRAVVEALATETDAIASYRGLIRAFLIEGASLSSEAWQKHQARFLAVASALCEGDTTPDKATNFLSWEQVDPSLSPGGSSSSKDVDPNMYRVEDGERYVDIMLGSIHSVKGQTHLATMLLNTYWNGHSSKRILPWLLGQRSNGDDINVQDSKRLLQTYVAITRPSHLVCLAIQRSAFGDSRVFSESLVTLKVRGWNVAELVNGVTQWLE
ncbi:MAG TPA: UvrD-helicase domain-containing protein [bacterium]|mgnify:CR=1 FL=1|nr:UvrD-helicase domain-containing protein [bacterium]HPQ65762.1 UvrD-helicase domain-containing protein [bacterium]